MSNQRRFIRIPLPAGRVSYIQDCNKLPTACDVMEVVVEADLIRDAYTLSFREDGSEATVPNSFLQLYGKGDGPLRAIQRMLTDMVGGPSPLASLSWGECVQAFIKHHAEESHRRQMSQMQMDQMRSLGMAGLSSLMQQQALGAPTTPQMQQNVQCPITPEEAKIWQKFCYKPTPEKPKHPNIAWLDQRINEVKVNLADIGVT